MSHFIYCYAECQYAEGRYAECHYAECLGAVFVPSDHFILFMANINHSFKVSRSWTTSRWSWPSTTSGCSAPGWCLTRTSTTLLSPTWCQRYKTWSLHCRRQDQISRLICDTQHKGHANTVSSATLPSVLFYWFIVLLNVIMLYDIMLSVVASFLWPVYYLQVKLTLALHKQRRDQVLIH